jgi:hypothetical protein
MSKEPEWLTELLEQAEQQEKLRLQDMNRHRADQILQLIRKLEVEADNINSLANEEVQLIEEFRTQQLTKIQKKIDWFVLNLSGFMNTQDGIKTLELPHGVLKKRKSHERILVDNLEKFLPEGTTMNLLRTIPEKFEPDATLILKYIHKTGVIPAGVNYLAADTRFSYITKKGDNSNVTEQREQTEVGTDETERVDSCKTVEG